MKVWLVRIRRSFLQPLHSNHAPYFWGTGSSSQLNDLEIHSSVYIIIFVTSVTPEWTSLISTLVHFSSGLNAFGITRIFISRLTCLHLPPLSCGALWVWGHILHFIIQFPMTFNYFRLEYRIVYYTDLFKFKLYLCVGFVKRLIHTQCRGDKGKQHLLN